MSSPLPDVVRPLSRPTRYPARWVAYVLQLALLACSDPPQKCAAGACPAGYTCVAETGHCELQAAGAASHVGLFGRFATVARKKAAPVAVGFSAERQSLAVVTDDGVAFLAGPAATPGEPAAGQACAAVHTADGQLAIAWLRPSDHSVWLASGTGSKWSIAQVDPVLAGKAAPPIALVQVAGRPVIAVRDADKQSLRLLSPLAPKGWAATEVPMPPGPTKTQPPCSDFGQAFSMVALPAGVAIAGYDATYGDLVLAVQTSDDWSLSRVAGTDPVTGIDNGDMGAASALALAPNGTLVVAWRDRSRDAVMLARATNGVLVAETVATGNFAGPAGTVQRALVGASLTLALQQDGRAAVGWFNGTTWRVELALQRASGGFTKAALPALTATQTLQLWPALADDGAGGLWLSWVESQAGRVPASSRLVHDLIAPGVWP